MSRTQHAGKALDWPKVGTSFDLRSPPDDVRWGRWRYVLNMRHDDRYGWGRRSGFVRYGADLRVPANADLHIREGDEDITSLYSHQATSGYRRLFAGTETRVYSQCFDGRWRCLGDFTAGTKFQFAGVNDVVFATNGRDVVKYHVLGERLDADEQAFHTVKGLFDIGLSTAQNIVSWNGSIFLMDVTMDGVRVAHRVVWSDTNDPLSWVPSTDSVAGFQDLDPGETILAGAVLGDALFLFTNTSIWRVINVGGEETFAFQRVYKHSDGEGCLRGRNCLAVVNGSAVYLSHDSLYVFGPFSAVPEKPEWVFLATKRMMQNADFAQCAKFAAGYHPPTEEFWISYVEAQQSKPSRTLCVNFRNQSADEIDHGFQALLSTAIDTRLALYEWMEQELGCSATAINNLWPTDREDNYPSYTGATRDLYDLCDDEDFLGPCPDCQAASRFLLVSSEDSCIKQEDPDTYAREIWNGTAYVLNGYSSRFLTGAIDFGTLDWKRLSEVAIGFTAPATDTPRSLVLKVGVSSVPADILDTGACFTKVFTLSSKALACPTAAPAATVSRLPNAHHRWPVLIEGRYLSFDFTIAAATGGAFWLSRFTATVGKSPNTST